MGPAELKVLSNVDPIAVFVDHAVVVDSPHTLEELVKEVYTRKGSFLAVDGYILIVEDADAAAVISVAPPVVVVLN